MITALTPLLAMVANQPCLRGADQVKPEGLPVNCGMGNNVATTRFDSDPEFITATLRAVEGRQAGEAASQSTMASVLE
jgi:hypothetical protein